MTERFIHRRIAELTENIDSNLALCLLLFRGISEKGIHKIGAKMSDDSDQNNIEDTDNETPWEIISKGRKGYFRDVIRELVCIYNISQDIEQFLIQTFQNDDSNWDAVFSLVDFLSDIPMERMATVQDCFRSLLVRNCNDEVAKHSDWYMPKEIMQCMAEVLDIHGGSVYDPCCGSGMLLLTAHAKLDKDSQCRLIGQAIDPRLSMITKLSLALQGVDYSIETDSARAVQNDLFPNQFFDYILANPPFNYKLPESGHFDYYDPRWICGLPSKSNCNFAWIQHIVYHLSDHGKAAIIMSNGTLSSPAVRDKKIREAIIESGIVEAIVVFPKYLFHGTEVPFCMWLLNKDHVNRDNVLFLDLTKSTYAKDKKLIQIPNYVIGIVSDYRSERKITQSSERAIVSVKQISENGYILSPNLYLPSEYQIAAKTNMNMLREELGRLENIPRTVCMQLEQWLAMQPAVSWSRMNLMDAYEVTGGISKSKDAIGHGYPMVDTSMVIKNRFIPDAFTQYIEADIGEQCRFCILEGDVILNRTSEAISSLACCCIADRDYDAVYSGYTKRLRPIYREMLDYAYMAGFFSSEIYRKQITDLSPAFTTRASINNDTLSKIHIYYPNREMQKKLGNILHVLHEVIVSAQQREVCIRLQKIWDILVEQFITLPILEQMRKWGSE